MVYDKNCIDRWRIFIRRHVEVRSAGPSDFVSKTTVIAKRRSVTRALQDLLTSEQTIGFYSEAYQTNGRFWLRWVRVQ